jgi:hypothetical protein
MASDGFHVRKPVPVGQVVAHEYGNAPDERWFLHELLNGGSLICAAALDFNNAAAGLYVCFDGQVGQDMLNDFVYSALEVWRQTKMQGEGTAFVFEQEAAVTGDEAAQLGAGGLEVLGGEACVVQVTTRIAALDAVNACGGEM